MGIHYDAAVMTGELESYSDADYASDQATRRSVSGIVFKWRSHHLGEQTAAKCCPVNYGSRICAVSENAKDAVWLSCLFNEISLMQTVPLLLVDNASAIRLAKNPSFHKRSKHIDVRALFVRERVQNGELKIEHVSSRKQVADILTKPIPRMQSQQLRRKLGMIEH